ncbi:TetR family transcriptional regulator [Pseudoglutamicibacter albus]|uniref:TetR family transcriptional regulator n=1 Tax=Pseudoglutamicibacter albus TaxID=98671 RepID=UPI003B8A915B
MTGSKQFARNFSFMRNLATVGPTDRRKVDAHQTDANSALIADAAIRVMVNKGLDTLSVRNVAAEAGVAPGTVQYQMGTRNDIIAKAFITRLASRLIRRRGGELPGASMQRARSG